MIIVSDTSPINYLRLINQIDILPCLFQNIIIPDQVRNELCDRDAPLVLQQWMANPPAWLVVKSVSAIDVTLANLDLGEQAAITLAQTLPADLLIMDERLGRRLARERGIAVIGTLGLLDDAATQGLVNLTEAIEALQKTNFRISRSLMQGLLNKPRA